MKNTLFVDLKGQSLNTGGLKGRFDCLEYVSTTFDPTYTVALNRTINIKKTLYIQKRLYIEAIEPDT